MWRGPYRKEFRDLLNQISQKRACWTLSVRGVGAGKEVDTEKEGGGGTFQILVKSAQFY